MYSFICNNPLIFRFGVFWCTPKSRKRPCATLRRASVPRYPLRCLEYAPSGGVLGCPGVFASGGVRVKYSMKWAILEQNGRNGLQGTGSRSERPTGPSVGGRSHGVGCTGVPSGIGADAFRSLGSFPSGAWHLVCNAIRSDRVALRFPLSSFCWYFISRGGVLSSSGGRAAWHRVRLLSFRV